MSERRQADERATRIVEGVGKEGAQVSGWRSHGMPHLND